MLLKIKLLYENLFIQIHKQNKTKLAEIVRESYYGRLAPSILSQVSPLQLLVEVGFDKLLRDYTHMFLGEMVLQRLIAFYEYKQNLVI